jgi:3'(2'), 5'-bisphosphate nucleotidase
MIEKIIDIVRKTEQPVLDIYNSDRFDVEIKGDNSPLTRADKLSNDIIMGGLKSHFPDIPVISEEGKDTPYEKRKGYSRFFLVDPLDGTKEFIKKNGEFTVNVALIENNRPVLGVISAPVLKDLYYGLLEEGAYKIHEGSKEQIQVDPNIEDGVVTVQSRSHSGEAEKEFYSEFNVTDSISKGSSLKFCMVAEGKAHLYFRSGPTMEWDTAAGHAILESAGGYVYTGKKIFKYNKEILKNPGFVASSFDLYE